MKQNRDYWKENLITWEAKRYSDLALLNPFSIPLRKRMECCEKILFELIGSDKSTLRHVNEFGCGSGLFAKRLSSMEADLDYIGFDISVEGIEAAQRRNLGTNFKFEVNDLTNLKREFRSDISIFLGLSDWLSKKENYNLLQAISSRYFLWSYTRNDDREFQSLSYSFFRKFRDKKSRKALSWTEKEVDQFLKDCNLKRFLPDQKFSFGPGVIACLVREDVG